MNTTDPLYWKPCLPFIRLKNTTDTTDFYTYSAFTGAATGITNVFPIHCSVSLSQNTHGGFLCQFEDQSKQMEAAGITVGTRFRISAGKDGAATTRLISGLVRKKGYSRGADNKIIYTIQGSSTGIRINELITYIVSKGKTLRDGFTPDINDATRKADTLLATALAGLTNDGILSVSNLAANSDVETFIGNLDIQYGELQDVVNYIEGQSGGEVIIDTNDLVNFRYEIKNNFFGRGFTIKNNRDNQANDDADDTMYLEGKNWNYEEDYYKSANYANRIYAILPADHRPSREDLGFVPTGAYNFASAQQDAEIAVKFRPTHTRHYASDFSFVGAMYTTLANQIANPYEVFVCWDYFGLPQDTDGIIGWVQFNKDQWADPIPTSNTEDMLQVHTGDILFNRIIGTTAPIYLDITRDYWLIFTRYNFYNPNQRMMLGKNVNVTSDGNFITNQGGTMCSSTRGGSGWHAITGFTGAVACAVGRYRAHSYVMYDPKAMAAISSGLPKGQPIDMALSDTSPQITTQPAMHRHLANQISVSATPRTVFNFPRVTAPNILPVPGDPIILVDDVLDFSTSGDQVAILSCGDMNYSWGAMDKGDYAAPTILNINAVGVLPKYS